MSSTSTNQATFFVLAGDGINCERETARAVELAGASARIEHVNRLLEAPEILDNYQAMIIPGGFSFGDDLGSGQVLALKMKTKLADALQEFVAKQKPILGICNGFQALVKLGILPTPFGERTMALAHNSSGEFINRWVTLKVNKKSNCVWLKNIHEDTITLPIRHGEGRVVFTDDSVLRAIQSKHQDALVYEENVNGSTANIAAVCDEKGLILGMMPHPEAAVSVLQYPNSMQYSDRAAEGWGLHLFTSCVEYLA